MLESFLITSRETLEASLVVGIVVSYLNRTDNKHYKKTVGYGIAAGILASLIAAFLFIRLAGDFQGRAEQLFEGVTMLIGAFLLTTMILWMMRQRQVTQKIHSRVEQHLQQENKLFSHFGIFVLIAVAIIREGVETVIFMSAINYSRGAVSFIGASLGILVAVVAGYLVYIGSKKINLKKVFTISSILLILFAAGLMVRSSGEFEEAGLVSGIVAPLFDLNPIITQESFFGSFLHGFLGYVAAPSLLQAIVYVLYLAIIFYLYRRAIHAVKNYQS